ncbi:hypothetical protein ABIB27_000908 [Arthrobacter sp. UYEF21]
MVAATAATAGTTYGCRTISGLTETGGNQPGRPRARHVRSTATPIRAAKYQTSAPPRMDTPENAVDATGTMARPVPVNATAAGRSRGTLAWSTMPAP